MAIDIVNRCSPLPPTDEGDFEVGGHGAASDRDTLIGGRFASRFIQGGAFSAARSSLAGGRSAIPIEPPPL